MSPLVGTDPILATILRECLRLVILVGLPLSAAVLLAGLIAAALQGFTRIHDHVIGYSLRAGAALVAGYLLFPTLQEGIARLILLALNPR